MTQTNLDLEWWKKIRASGRGWFLVREGIVRHGTRVGFWVVTLGALASLGEYELTAHYFLLLALIWALLSVCFGSLIGIVLWNQYEKNYRESKG